MTSSQLTSVSQSDWSVGWLISRHIAHPVVNNGSNRLVIKAQRSRRGCFSHRGEAVSPELTPEFKAEERLFSFFSLSFLICQPFTQVIQYIYYCIPKDRAIINSSRLLQMKLRQKKDY